MTRMFSFKFMNEYGMWNMSSKQYTTVINMVFLVCLYSRFISKLTEIVPPWKRAQLSRGSKLRNRKIVPL